MTKILIVCANSLHANTISMVLQSHKVDIECINHEQCVLTTCRQHPFELILFLGISPYFTSMNIVEELRLSLNYRPSIYVVADNHSEGVILSLLECGVNQYITLPVNLYRLREKVYKHLNIS